MNSGESKTFSHWNCDRKASADRRDLKGPILVCFMTCKWKYYMET